MWELREAGRNKMIRVNFKLRRLKLHFVWAGRGKEANLGTTAAALKQRREDFFLAAPVPPSTTCKSSANGYFQGCCTLKWRKESQNNWGFLSSLGCRKQLSIAMSSPWQNLWSRISDFTCSQSLHMKGKDIYGVCRMSSARAQVEG